MNGLTTRDALTSLLAQEGRTLLENPKRVEGLLFDLCPDRKREIVLLGNALRERVPEDLLAPVSSSPPPMMRIRLQKRLEENLSVTEGAAVWAVETWAVALGAMSPGEATSSPLLQNSLLPHSIPGSGTSRPAPPNSASASWPGAPPPAPPGWEQPAGGSASSVPPNSVPPPYVAPPYAPPPYPAPGFPQQQTTWPPAPNPGGGMAAGHNDSGTGSMAVLPAELRGFNWGAFWLTWIWSIRNKTYIGLLALVPYAGIIMSFILGFKGNEMAWQNCRWSSIQEFKDVQGKWTTAGWIVLGVLIVLGIISAVAGNHS